MYPVSVIIPTLGRPETFRAIQSVVDQTYKGEIEIVVVDDGDHHDEEKIKSLAKEKRYILYAKLKERKGSPHARNIGWSLSNGVFTAFLDDDDEWYPEKLEKQINLLLQHPDCPIVTCYSHDLRFENDRLNKPPSVINHEKIIKSFNISSTSSLVTRKNLFQLLGGFDESLSASQEYDLALRYSKYHDIRCVPEVLIQQNPSKEQISENWTKKIRGVLGIYRKYHREYHIKDHIRTVGLLTLFILANIIGNKVYKIILPVKERYEE